MVVMVVIITIFLYFSYNNCKSKIDLIVDQHACRNSTSKQFLCHH